MTVFFDNIAKSCIAGRTRRIWWSSLAKIANDCIPKTPLLRKKRKKRKKSKEKKANYHIWYYIILYNVKIVQFL